MEFKTSRLREAVDAIGKFTNRRSPSELHQAVMIRAKPTGVSVEAGCADGFARIFVPGEGAAERSPAIVQHKYLSALLSGATGEFVELKSDNNVVLLSSGGLEAEIAALDQDGWHVSDEAFPQGDKVSFPIDDAMESSKRVQFASVNSDHRFASCQRVIVGGGKMQFISGDQRVGAVSWFDGVEGELSVGISPSAIESALGCMAYSSARNGEMSLNESGWMTLTANQVEVYIPTVGGARPEKDVDSIKSLLTTGEEWSLSKDEIFQFCDQVASISNAYSTAVKLEPLGSTLRMSYEGVCFSDRSKDIPAKCSRQIPGQCEGRPVYVSHAILKKIIKPASEKGFRLWQGDRFIGVTSDENYIAVAGLISPEAVRV